MSSSKSDEIDRLIQRKSNSTGHKVAIKPFSSAYLYPLHPIDVFLHGLFSQKHKVQEVENMLYCSPKEFYLCGGIPFSRPACVLTRLTVLIHRCRTEMLNFLI